LTAGPEAKPFLVGETEPPTTALDQPDPVESMDVVYDLLSSSVS
jgi:hypothetical protein